MQDKKPSERIWEIINAKAGTTDAAFIMAIIEYLDEQYEKEKQKSGIVKGGADYLK